MLDGAAEFGDIANWGLGFDLTEPSEVEGHGEIPPGNAVWNTPPVFKVECRYLRAVTHYAGDVTMTIASGAAEMRSGVRWIGSDGWVRVDRDGLEVSNSSWLANSLPEELKKVQLYESDNHWRNFLDSVKSRRPTVSTPEAAHRATIPAHLGIISMALGEKIIWDPAREETRNNRDACKLLTQPYRPPWTLDWSSRFARPDCR